MISALKQGFWHLKIPGLVGISLENRWYFVEYHAKFTDLCEYRNIPK